MRGNFLDRRPILLVCYFLSAIILTILTLHPLFLSLSFVAAVFWRIFSGGIKRLKILLWMTPMFIFIIFINPLFVHQGETILFFLVNAPITLEAVMYGICNALLLATVTLWIALLFDVVTADKLRLLVEKRFPSLTMLLIMIIRILPTMRRKAEEIKSARYGIGLTYQTDNIFNKAKETAEILTILTQWGLEYSIHTANVLLARGSKSSLRSFYKRRAYAKSDIAFLIIILVCATTTIFAVIASESTQFYTIISFPTTKTIWIAFAAETILFFMPITDIILEEIWWIRYKLKIFHLNIQEKKGLP